MIRAAGARRARRRVQSPTGDEAPAAHPHHGSFTPLDRREPTQRHPAPNWPFLYTVVPGRGVVKNVARRRAVLAPGAVTKKSVKTG